MIHRVLKGFAPLAMLAGAMLVSACDGVDIQIGDSDGVPLAELDMTGAPPSELVFAGPDKVIVTKGDTLDIDVSGDEDAIAELRFSLDGDALGISRESSDWGGTGIATIRVTTPDISTLVLAGSGDVEVASMQSAADSAVTIAGSGKARIADLDAKSLDLTIAGSGNFEASGKVDQLDLTIAGSGKADMAGLQAGGADITVAGSGDAEFASDGKVEASIMGSGTVTVNGRADCTVSSMGSGKLNCRAASTAAPNDEPEAETEPQA